MRQVRLGVFETNSSSTHSLTIDGGQFEPDHMFVEDGVLEIHPGKFGWEWRDYRDAHTKASYLLTWLREMPRNYKTRVDEEERRFVRVLKRVTGAKKVRFVPLPVSTPGGGQTLAERRWVKSQQWGYIDHQSIEGGGGPGKAALESEESIERFVFNPKSVLHTGNDNSPYGSW